MKGILPLLFICVTLHLANGNFYSRPQEQGHYLKSELHAFRQDWNPYSEGMKEKLERDLKKGRKGPVTIVGEALMDTIMLLLDDTPKVRSAEGQHRSDLSDLDFQQSSSSSESDTMGEFEPPRKSRDQAPETSLNSFSEERTNSTSGERCVVRQIIDLLSLLVSNTYDEEVRKNGRAPTGPKLLHLLVNELNENLESLNEIEILDATLFRFGKLIRRFLKGLRINLTSSEKLTTDMNSLVNFLAKIETFFDNYIDADREMTAAGNYAPAVRLLLDEMEQILEELSEGKALSNAKKISNLSRVRTFVNEMRKNAEILILSKPNKDSNPLTQVLVGTKAVLGQMIQEMRLFETQSGSLNHFTLSLIMAVHSRLIQLVQETGKKEPS